MSQIEAIKQMIEGERLPQSQTNRPIICDSCDSKIHPNRRMSVWLTGQDIFGHKQETLAMYRIHCMDCTPSKLVWKSQGLSPKGWLEVVFETTLTTEYTMTEAELLYASSPNNGSNWTPEEVMDATFPFDDMAKMATADLDGPMDLIELMFLSTIDPREIITEDGVVDQPPEKKRENHKKLRDNLKRKVDSDAIRRYYERFGSGLEDDK